MGDAVRLYDKTGIYSITARTYGGQPLIKPSRKLGAVAGGILARASRMYGIGLRGFAMTGTGLRLLVRATGTSVSRFMQYLLGNLSRKLRCLLGLDGPLWHRRFRCVPVLDPAAELAQLEELLRLGLHSLPGFSCIPWLIDVVHPRLRWYDWNSRWASRGPEQPSRWSSTIASAESLHLEPVTAWAALPRWQRQAMARSLVARLRREQPAPLWGPAVACHVSSELVRRQFLVLRRALLARYRLASAAFRLGADGHPFPSHSIMPSIPSRSPG